MLLGPRGSSLQNTCLCWSSVLPGKLQAGLGVGSAWCSSRGHLRTVQDPLKWGQGLTPDFLTQSLRGCAPRISIGHRFPMSLRPDQKLKASGRPEMGGGFVQFSRSVVSNSLWPHRPQHTRLPCPLPTPGICSDSCPSSKWCRPTISSSVIPYSLCLQTFPESGSFPMSQFFASGGQSSGVSASASVLPMNIQDWFLLELTVLISLKFKGLLRVFSNTTVQKHQFFGAQLSLWSNSHPYMTTGKTIVLTTWIFVGKIYLCFLICYLGLS